jgi:hypothetical protein
MQPVVDSIHELFVSVEMLGSHPDLHLGEEMVTAWRQVCTLRGGGWSKISQLKILIKAFVQAVMWGYALLCMSIPRRLFWIDLRTVTHNVITVYTTQLMNLGRSLSFCVKDANHSTYLTAGGSGDDIAHVSSVITPTLRSENVRG